LAGPRGTLDRGKAAGADDPTVGLWECLAIDVTKRLTSEDVLERLSNLFVHSGVPQHIRSDNGSEFTAKCIREWLGRVGIKTLFIECGSPWEDGYVESFNGP